MKHSLVILSLLLCISLYSQEFTYGEFGVKKKTAVYDTNVDGSITKYSIEDFALETKEKTYKKDIQGNIEVYKYGKFGIKHKTKEIHDTDKTFKLNSSIFKSNRQLHKVRDIPKYRREWQ